MSIAQNTFLYVFIFEYHVMKRLLDTFFCDCYTMTDMTCHACLSSSLVQPQNFVKCIHFSASLQHQINARTCSSCLKVYYTTCLLLSNSSFQNSAHILYWGQENSPVPVPSSFSAMGCVVLRDFANKNLKKKEHGCNLKFWSCSFWMVLFVFGPEHTALIPFPQFNDPTQMPLSPVM